MNDIEQAIYDAAVRYDAYAPEQVVRVLHGAITDPTDADAAVKRMRDDMNTYGGLFRARVIAGVWQHPGSEGTRTERRVSLPVDT